MTSSKIWIIRLNACKSNNALRVKWKFPVQMFPLFTYLLGYIVRMKSTVFYNIDNSTNRINSSYLSLNSNYLLSSIIILRLLLHSVIIISSSYLCPLNVIKAVSRYVYISGARRKCLLIFSNKNIIIVIIIR